MFNNNNLLSTNQVSFNVRSARPRRDRFFTEGVWAEVTQTVHNYCAGQPLKDNAAYSTGNSSGIDRATAVFLNWPRLTTTQVITMQEAWRVPVYDRYTLVVQLFTSRARTQEAKIQAQLSELILLRSRIPILLGSSALRDRTLDSIPFGGSFSDRLSQLLRLRESHLMDELNKIEKRRNIMRKQRRERQEHQLPTVTVVGYTNAGKTSLIRSLTGNAELVASPRVFATLDITHHRTRLSMNLTEPGTENKAITQGKKMGIPGIQLLLLDTIGFMEDLPTSLIAAFRSTLDECLDTDLILHLVDISEPGWEHRVAHVDGELSQAGIDISPAPDNVSPSASATTPSPARAKTQLPVLHIGNKVDRGLTYLTETNRRLLDVVISTKQGTGLHELAKRIEMELVKFRGWCRRTVALSQSSTALRYHPYETFTVSQRFSTSRNRVAFYFDSKLGHVACKKAK
ncbi:unnamed protein product [Echinostoma caproni]|uniref:Hflx-type G domain-containing protein n=1 Tax=Echinostoma caproni TaxID=27848 RepID=A0A3P8GGQ9_9TREM|nr:unnamed protein product [Echinostoma caproni]